MHSFTSFATELKIKMKNKEEQPSFFLDLK